MCFNFTFNVNINSNKHQTYIKRIVFTLYIARILFCPYFMIIHQNICKYMRIRLILKFYMKTFLKVGRTTFEIKIIALS